MIRGTFANIRLRNQLLDDVSGGYTRDFSRAVAGVHRRRAGYAAQHIPLVVFGGKEYWVGFVTGLGGQRHIATGRRAGGDRQSFERIRELPDRHGRDPLQFPEGKSASSLGLDGTRVFDITGIDVLNDEQDTQDGVRPGHQGDGATISSTPWCASAPVRRTLPQRRHPAVRA